MDKKQLAKVSKIVNSVSVLEVGGPSNFKVLRARVCPRPSIGQNQLGIGQEHS